MSGFPPTQAVPSVLTPPTLGLGIVDPDVPPDVEPDIVVGGVEVVVGVGVGVGGTVGVGGVGVVGVVVVVVAVAVLTLLDGKAQPAAPGPTLLVLVLLATGVAESLANSAALAAAALVVGGVGVSEPPGGVDIMSFPALLCSYDPSMTLNDLR